MSDNRDILSFAELIQKLAERVMTRAGTSDIKAGSFFDQYRIRLGTFQLTGKNEEEALDRLLFWLLSTPPKYTSDEVAAALKEVTQQEEADDEVIISLLAEGGMTDHGKKVEIYRQERGLKLYQALDQLEREHGPINRLFTHMDALVALTGYEDLDLVEVLHAVQDRRRLKEELGQLSTQ